MFVQLFGQIVKSKRSTGKSVSAFPPRLVGDFLNRREQVLETRARAEVDLGAHLHAGKEAQRPAVTFELSAPEIDEGAVSSFLR